MAHHLLSSYADLADLADFTGETPASGSTDEAMAVRLLLAASRQVDHHTKRFFGQEVGDKVFNVRRSGQVEYVVPDLAAAPTVLQLDADRDGTYETDLIADGVVTGLTPDVPPYYLLELLKDYPFIPRWSRLKIGSLWGWPRDLQTTGDFVSGSQSSFATTLSVVSGTAFKPGQVILIDSEQELVTAKSGTTLTVIRGINGSTAVLHSGVPVDIIRATYDVRNAAAIIATRFYKRAKVAFADPNIANTFTGALTDIQPLVRILLGQGLPKEVELLLNPLKLRTMRGG